MNEIAEGNLDARIEVNSTDEIGEVGASFNVMAKRLQENIVEMVEQEKREQQLKYGLMISQVDPYYIEFHERTHSLQVAAKYFLQSDMAQPPLRYQ